MTHWVGSIVKIKHDTTASNRSLVKAGSFGKVIDMVRSTLTIQINNGTNGNPTLVALLVADVNMEAEGEKPWWMDYGVSFDDHKAYTKSMRAD